jgi:hypothetical protein
VAIGDDTVQPNFMEVGCLKLQHLVNTSTVDGVSGLANFLVIALTTKAGSDQLLAVLVKKIERGPVCARRDLDQLGKAVSDLCLGKCLQEREI